MPDEKPAMDPRLRITLYCVGGSGFVLALGGAVVLGLRVGLGVAIGAAVGTLNLYVLARIIRTYLPIHSPAVGTFALLKMLGLFGLVWFLMGVGVVDPIPVVVGLGALPIGIAIGTLVSDRTAPKDPPDDELPDDE